MGNEGIPGNNGLSMTITIQSDFYVSRYRKITVKTKYIL